jgi:hypothetical protein
MAQQSDVGAMGPWLLLAVVCQTALVENNGQLSIIRIFDRMVVPGTAEQMGQTTINFTIVVIFKAGELYGNHKIGIQPYTPNNEPMPPMEFPALFEGQERGIQIILPIGFPVSEDGLYWFDVSVNGQRYTRIPLRIIYQQIALPGQLSMGLPPSQ